MAGNSRGWTITWFACAILISAFLVFQIQPLISKTILPWFGGSPAVWTTCMLFFQVLLFAGYAYAHLTTRFLPSRWQAALHFLLIVGTLLLMPLAPTSDWMPTGQENPTLWILAILLAHVGLPYFVLSATGPLLQAWFASAVPGRSPYRLYALSNVGSLAALLSYPFFVEPSLTTASQGYVWSLAFCMFALCCGYLAASRFRQESSQTETQRTSDWELENGAPPTWRQRWGWLLLPALASVMLLAITNHVCQDVAVIPFLWVIPLSLYLLTFIICFDRPQWYSRRWCGGLALVTLMLVNLAPMFWWGKLLPVELSMYFATLLFVCMVCHGELVGSKPHPRHLTAFYLMSAAGGAVGGVTVGLLCPWLFSSYMEFHLSLMAAVVVTSGVFLLDATATWLGDTPPRRRIALLGYFAVFVFIGQVQFGHEDRDVVASVRNFYGVLRLKENSLGTQLIHGRIVHGFQFRDAARRGEPTTYYARHSGVGLALTHWRPDQPKRVGVVGLGCGTVAAYGQPGDYYRFYEINPAVVELAQQHFDFLSSCAARTEVILGDARISLEREAAQQFDVLILDAFSGDSIPTHLLTKEAFDGYLRHLKPEGVIAVHISNQHLDLEPVVQRLATHAGLESRGVVTPDDMWQQAFASRWVLLTADEAFFQSPAVLSSARPLRPGRLPLWTDQHNNIVQLLR